MSEAASLGLKKEDGDAVARLGIKQKEFDEVDAYVATYLRPITYIDDQEMAYTAAAMGMSSEAFHETFGPLVSDADPTLTSDRYIELTTSKE